MTVSVLLNSHNSANYDLTILEDNL